MRIKAARAIPEGSYPAVVGGHQSEFKVNGVTYTAEFPIGVRGIGIEDTITIKGESITSLVLGSDGVLQGPVMSQVDEIMELVDTYAKLYVESTKWDQYYDHKDARAKVEAVVTKALQQKAKAEAPTSQQPVGYVMSEAEYMRTDGRTGKVIWISPGPPFGATLYAGLPPEPEITIATVAKAAGVKASVIFKALHRYPSITLNQRLDLDMIGTVMAESVKPKITLKQFAEMSGIIVKRCGKEWGGTWAYSMKCWPTSTKYGMKSEKAVYKRWAEDLFGKEAFKALKKLLKE